MKELSHPGKLLSLHLANIVQYDIADKVFCKISKFHDLGKVVKSFQDYMDKLTKSAEPHALISSVYFLLRYADELDTKSLVFGMNSIISHHGRLKSFIDLLNTFFNESKLQLIKKQYNEIQQNKDAIKYFELKNISLSDVQKTIQDKILNLEDIEFDIDDFVRQKELFSKLIFADKFEAIFSYTPSCISKEYAKEMIDEYKTKKNFLQNDLRDNARETIVKKYNLSQNELIYQLTAPTGIGKTLLSLEIALKIKKNQNKNRIIYAIPFTSIIDQVAEIFTEIYPNIVTIHHHMVDFSAQSFEEEKNSYDRIKYLTQSWNDPFIISTFYQLFFAIFSNENSDNIKFQSLRNSVIILDEVQAIPFELWDILKELFPTISKRLNTTFVLMSATMPIITNGGYELCDRELFYSKQNRYKLNLLTLKSSCTDEMLEELYNEILFYYNSGKSVLCVVNTIKNSKRLFSKLSEKLSKNLYCLNSYMLIEDRQNTIKNLKEKSSNMVKNKILISTQVIEAGIDLDFDVGFRELAPFSSIIQTAGRVNREGKKEISDVFVFDTIEHSIYDDILIHETRELMFGSLIQESLEEKDILKFADEYFGALDKCLGDRFNILENIKSFNFDAISEANKKAFKTEDDHTVSVALGIDLFVYEKDYFEKKKTFDLWELKTFKEKQFKVFSHKILNIKKCDLSGIATKKSEIYGVEYIDELSDLYSKEKGFLILEERTIFS
ncbi:CRISPR-associated helicase/endonuclease Cas3 [Campylobacter hyointestinalis]|uniref:CRISPR-associated helicase/endonuclease Cas3 n=1 Tax=Campylobacter hyointestinalis TaxID=198 RepID=UPI000CE33AD4|nr:CRISPR-associated helicase/endonuclease Cas3 [Campylobacter hyointestinalis]PPB73389.1 hypothetical protein CDQ79_03535 [Campylobacter hyointestinalis subsp. hyointestinalis]PPB75601.1 hypothetical protein CDQ80_00030 [Campylobacter hyointestinalis subsp. hyointestinalis]PPB78258.1 hypothetical protein CDQ81_01765 [Campylobacter hyointestinalis subsp. hyointestinalis]PPB78835.1 hypothetical protein CDQ82_01640 [Campylobacter hyointestinalis subsp. hyointestinalis]